MTRGAGARRTLEVSGLRPFDPVTVADEDAAALAEPFEVIEQW